MPEDYFDFRPKASAHHFWNSSCMKQHASLQQVYSKRTKERERKTKRSYFTNLLANGIGYETFLFLDKEDRRNLGLTSKKTKEAMVIAERRRLFLYLSEGACMGLSNPLWDLISPAVRRKNTLRFFPRDVSYVEDIVCYASWPDVFEERFSSTENPLEGFFIVSKRSTTHAFFSKIIERKGLFTWKTFLSSLGKVGIEDFAVTVGLEHRFSEYDAFLISRQQEVALEQPVCSYRLDPKKRAFLVASTRELYTTLEAAPLHPSATYVVVKQVDLAEKNRV